MTDMERVKSYLKRTIYCLDLIHKRAGRNHDGVLQDDCMIGKENTLNALTLLEKMEGDSDGSLSDSGTPEGGCTSGDSD